MSKTDKTVPFRVQRMRERIEDHDHRHGQCDLHTDSVLHRSIYQVGQRCSYTVAEPSWIKSFTRSAAVRGYARELQRIERQRQRRALRAARYGDTESWQDFDLADYKTRGNAFWLAY